MSLGALAFLNPWLLGALLTLRAVFDQERWRDGRLRALHWLWPMVAFNLFVLAGTLGTNGSVLLLGGLNLLVGAGLMVAEPVGRVRVARWAGVGMAGLAVVGLAASSLDLPVTRTRTENTLRRTGLPAGMGIGAGPIDGITRARGSSRSDLPDAG